MTGANESGHGQDMLAVIEVDTVVVVAMAVVIVIMIGKIYQSNQSCSMELHCL